MTYATSYTTRKDNRWLDAILAIVYAIVIGAIAYAVPVTELLNKVTYLLHSATLATGMPRPPVQAAHVARLVEGLASKVTPKEN